MGSLLRHDYLDADTLAGFRTYKYSCLDTSPLSVYIMHPFWNRVVQLVPRNIAPNILTLIGFLCCIGHNLLTAIYDYHFTQQQPIPRLVWLSVSLLLFLAHTLDGIDGKQARRTNSSSPLGELFDHGCDAWSTVFIVTTFYSVFGRNLDGYSISPMRMYCIAWAVFWNFHISHAEKYNTGVMYLPWSYDVAMVAGSLLYLFSAVVGTAVWKVKLPNDEPVGPYLVAVVYFFTLGLATPVALANIVRSYWDGTGKMRPVREAVRPMASFGVAATLCLAWAHFSPNQILDKDVRLFFYMSGTVYAHISCRLIVSQMSNSRCEFLNVLLLPLATSVTAALFVGLDEQSELNLLLMLAMLATMVHLHYSVNVVLQLCHFLDIPCFSIPVNKVAEPHDILQSLLPQNASDVAEELADSNDEATVNM